MRKARVEAFTEGIDLPFRDIDGAWVRELSEAICAALALEDVSISVILTDDDCIRSVNNQYRAKDRPTDVISFAYREDPFPEAETEMEELGDIYLSLERAAEQAVEYEVTLKEEVKRLLIHGILHLIGYDHERSAEDEETMRAKEEEVFDAVSL
jgi:probable rRNA maturation factor